MKGSFLALSERFGPLILGIDHRRRAGGPTTDRTSLISPSDTSCRSDRAQPWALALIIGERSKTLITWVILPPVTVRYSMPRMSLANGVSTT